MAEKEKGTTPKKKMWKKKIGIALALGLFLVYTGWVGGMLVSEMTERGMIAPLAESEKNSDTMGDILPGDGQEEHKQPGDGRTENEQPENKELEDKKPEEKKDSEKPEASDVRAGLGSLVQATGPAEEYLGAVHLGLLETKENDNGDMAQSIQNVLPSVVQIGVGSYWGSGVIWQINEDNVLIISSRHLLRHQDYSYVRFYNGKEASGRLLALSSSYDVGFLLADIGEWDYDSRMELRGIPLDRADFPQIESGDEIFLVGSTDGVACNIYEGTVADPNYYFEEFDAYMIYNYCKGKPGMSGGGTYDRYGYFIGMITGGLGEETASLPADNIEEEYEKLVTSEP